MKNYFRDILKHIDKDYRDMETIINKVISPLISEETNQRLIVLLDAKEIKDAIFSIHPGKAPGPDGFYSWFFQSNWNVMGEYVVKKIQDFFQSSCLPRTVNETHIMLIPKILSPKTVADFRSVALCNVVYKVISKLLAKRLQPHLCNLIIETQSAFVPKRAISDNVLIIHEFLRYLQTSKAK